MREKYAEIVSDFTYYAGIDYLADKTTREKIDWFEKRFSKIIIEPLQEVRRLGPDNPRIWDLNLGVVTLVCCAIEALGSFYKPSPKDQERKPYRKDQYCFISFVEDFMDAKYKQASLSREKFSVILYGKFRCGLAHGLSIEGHEVTTRPEEYLDDKDGYVSIDLWTLFDDFRNGFHTYVKKVRGGEADLQENFVSRFDEIFVVPYMGLKKTQSAVEESGSN